MNAKEVRTLYDYNAWANGRVFDAVSGLKDDELNRDLATSHGSVKGTLTHIVAGEWIWLMRRDAETVGEWVSPSNRFSGVFRPRMSMGSGSRQLISSERQVKTEQVLQTLIATVERHIADHN